MEQFTIGSATVDYSQDSGGVFFYRFELENFVSGNDSDFEVLAETLNQVENSTIDSTGRIRCPRHPEAVMMRRFYNPMRQVEIDECPACGGIWLDSGELCRVRQSKVAATPEKLGEAISRAVASAYVADAGSDSRNNPMNAQIANHRVPAICAAVAAVVLSLVVSADLQFRVVAHALVALAALWWPWFFVWDVPRRLHMRPAPIDYVYVFGWGSMLLAYGIAAYDLALN